MRHSGMFLAGIQWLVAYVTGLYPKTLDACLRRHDELIPDSST